MSFVQFGETKPSTANIKVVGVGGAGGNAVNAMVNAGVEGVDFIAVNTDVQVLESSLAHRKIQIGKNLTRGLGAGANPHIGQQAIEEDKEDVMTSLADSDMVFITAGMGGGTGTGAAPVIASIARELGALTVAVVTKPFLFEGKPRREKAEDGLKKLRDMVDTLIVIPNDRIFAISEPNTPVTDAFLLADNILLQATRGISDLITKTGYINLDFADVKSVMLNMGDALMGSGSAVGSNRATIAAQEAISSPLLEGVSIQGAIGVLINITAGKSLSIQEVNEAALLIQEQAGEDANVIFGMVFDENMSDEIRVTVIATGFNKDARQLRDLQSETKNTIEKKVQTKAFSYARPKPKVNPPLQKTTASSDQLHLLLSEEDDLPAFIRKKTDELPEEEKSDIPSFTKTIDMDESKEEDEAKHSKSPTDYDIPTFLRKSMD